MRNGKVASVGWLILLATGLVRAETVPLPTPDPERGSIGITVRALQRSDGRPKIVSAVEVFFVKLRSGQDSRRAVDVTRSTFARRDRVFLLNAEPGRYAAVAAVLPASSGQRVGSRAYFSSDLIPMTEVTVAPGQLVFMGEFVLNLSTRFRALDRAQAHYFDLIVPDVDQRSAEARERRARVSHRAWLRRAERDLKSSDDFWKYAVDKVFNRQPSWQAFLGERLQTSGAW